MSTVWRIREAATFAQLQRAGRRARRGPLTVRFLPLPSGSPQVAYAVSRRVGGAVVRNRVRRRLRHLVQELVPTMPVGAYLIGASPAAATAESPELRQALHAAVREASAGAQR